MSLPSIDRYLDEGFEHETSSFRVGRCHHKPSHAVYATVTDAEILFACSKGSTMWVRVKLSPELVRLNGKTTTKTALKQRLQLYLHRQQLDIGDVPENTQVIHIPVEKSEDAEDEIDLSEAESDRQNSVAGTDDEDSTKALVVSTRNLTVRKKGSATAHSLRKTSLPALAPRKTESLLGLRKTDSMQALSSQEAQAEEGTLPIYIYEDTPEPEGPIQVFNMFHISSTMLINAASLAVQIPNMYSAIRSGDGAAIWDSVLNAIGPFLPLPLASASSAARMQLGTLFRSRQGQSQLTFLRPSTVDSNADERLRQARAHGNRTCGPDQK